MTKKPFFKFFPNDWLSAPEIMIMTPAEEGAYIRLLSLCWANGGLPDDDDQLAVLSRMGKAWTKSKDRIRACFIRVDDRLQNKRLLAEWEKHEQFSEKQRANGQRGGRPKKFANQELNDNEEKGLGFSGFEKDKPKKSYSSSSSYSSSKENREGENPPPTHPQSGGNAKPKKAAKPKAIFQKPSETEVTMYFAELQTGVWSSERIAQQSARWYDHYLSNGWKVGRVPMSDWKAAVRKWTKNNFDSNSNTAHNATTIDEELERAKKRRQELEERTRRLADS